MDQNIEGQEPAEHTAGPTEREEARARAPEAAPLADRISSPSIKAFARPFPDLGLPQLGDVAGTFERLAELVGAWDRPAVIHFRLVDTDPPRSWSLDLRPEGTRVIAEAVRRPDLEVLLEQDVWAQLSSGAVSPLEAFGRGGMRVRGDIGLARRFVERVTNVGSGR